MSIIDPIANLLTSLSNASSVGKTEVRLPYSSYKERLLELLKSEGVIADFKKEDGEVGSALIATLNYKYKKFKRVSKPGRRLYIKSSQIPRKQQQLMILSTPFGLMTARQAIKKNTGGEVLLEVM